MHSLECDLWKMMDHVDDRDCDMGNMGASMRHAVCGHDGQTRQQQACDNPLQRDEEAPSAESEVSWCRERRSWEGATTHHKNAEWHGLRVLSQDMMFCIRPIAITSHIQEQREELREAHIKEIAGGSMS